MKHTIFCLACLCLTTIACEKEEQKIEYTVYQASGNIASKLEAFRNSLGSLNTSPNVTGGRREVSWDGVPDALLDQELPNDFFNPIGQQAVAARQRGLAYSGDGFQASASGFAPANSDAASEFTAFSGNRIFANVLRSAWPVTFQAAGRTAPASVAAFGAVFVDVDLPNSTFLEFFEGNKSLGRFAVPAKSEGANHSFLGVRFANRTITRVEVVHQGVLTSGGKDVSQGGGTDLVALDDLVYSEPVELGQ